MNIIKEIQKRWFPKTLNGTIGNSTPQEEGTTPEDETKCVYRKDILEYALKYHYSHLPYSGLCIIIKRALEHYGIYISSMAINTIIPLFNNDNARSLFNATLYESSYLSYWWPKGEWNTGRLDFLKWLLEQYKDDKTNLKEFKK